MLNYFETPIIEIHDESAEKVGVKILIKREDLNHPLVSGNKWWKLKYNLEEAKRLGQDTLLTFGGAFSNHIFATAAAAKELGLKSIGIIRGERTLPLNATLAFAESCGMQLHFISREDYRRKTEQSFIGQLKRDYGDFYLIPEGGTNALAVRGCAEFAREKIWSIKCNHVCLPVGTGGTLAGVVSGLKGETNVIGFSALKDGSFLREEIKSQLGSITSNNWVLQTDYHFAGYAKQTRELKEFIIKMKQEHNLLLDPIYTGKMMFGIFDLIKSSHFEMGSVILAIHTGGLQSSDQ
jgi:1-aminocyclopropane-1-carboxylate deaminase